MKKFIGTLLAIALVLSIMPLNVFSNSNSPTTYPEIKTDFQIVNKWDGYFIAEIKVKNLSNSAIENWHLSFNFPHEITSIENAQVLSWENNIYILRNMGWNTNIDAGSQISFRFTAAYDGEIVEPSDFKIVTKIVEVSADGYSIDFKFVSDWGSGFTSQMEIQNKSDKPIEAWQLKFDFDAKIDTIWGARIISSENGKYLIKNDGYNARILPGESVIIGFNGSPGKIAPPANYVLSHYSVGDVGDDEPEEADIKLTVERDELYVSPGETKTVHFYAETLYDTEEILLLDAVTGSIIATMVDDGKYSISGDDLANDNVYTCKVDIDISKERVFEFYAVIIDNHKFVAESNIVKIDIHAGYGQR